MGRHASGRRAGPPALPPVSLLVAIAAAAFVMAIILGAVASARHGPVRPSGPVNDLQPTPSLLLTPTPRPSATASH